MSQLAQFRRLRRGILRKRETRIAILGDGNGTIRVPGKISTVYIRLPGSMDANTDTSFTNLTTCKTGTASYPFYEGARVEVGFNRYDELSIIGADTRDMESAGIDSSILNSILPDKAFLYLRNVVRLMSRPVGQSGNTSTLVNVQSLIYHDNYGNLLHYAGTQKQSDKVDLASYIPTAGNHRIAVLFLRPVLQTIQVGTSTTQAMTSALDITDYQEAFVGRDPETIPIQAYVLANAAGSIDIRDLGEDLRQFLNMPHAWGFPNPVDQNEIVRSGRTVTHAGDLVTTADLIIDGDFIQLDGNIATRDVRRVTADYSIVSGDYTIFANTDSVAITITLPSGTQDRPVRIVNTGTSSNNVTIAPTGSDKIIGANSNWTLFDGEAMILQYDTTDGWY
jgi:hypothetical protein